MIFATVGTQLPFPRLIDALDALAPKLDEPVIAQTGTAGHWPRLEAHETLSPQAFAATFAAARVVVSHAGVGTLLSARRHRKPLVLLPRRFELGEHRSDHQMATARHVAGLRGLHVAWNVTDLDALLLTGDLEAPGEEGALSPGRAALIGRLQSFIHEGR